MEGESAVTRSIIDELQSWDIQRGQMEGESGVTRIIIDEHHSSDIEGDEMEVESGVTRSIIDELYSANMAKWNVKVVLLQVLLMNFILGMYKEIKRMVKVFLLEV